MRSLRRAFFVLVVWGLAEAASAQVCSYTLSPPTLPPGTVGVPYLQAVSATRTPPFVTAVTFTVGPGTLPPGLTEAELGVATTIISGTPTTAGSFTFTLTASDTTGCTGSQVYTIVIAAVAPTMPEWAALILAFLLLSLGYVVVRRRMRGAD